MFRNYWCFEMLLLFLLSNVKWNDPSYVLRSCSRTNSRLVRTIIHKKILPIFHRYKILPPLSCPFHVERDLLWWPNIEQHFRKRWWACPMCGKMYFDEEDLVDHWDNTHFSSLSQPEDSICLDSLCDIFRCDVITMNAEITSSNETHYPMPVQKTTNKPICDEKHMLEMHKKCKSLIHTCLLEALASISLKDFIDIEEELESSLCSYLTCHTYWDKTVKEIHRVPISFCIILMVFLFGVFYFCYYIILLLFDSSALDTEKTQCNGYHHTNSHGIKFRTPIASKYRSTYRNYSRG